MSQIEVPIAETNAPGSATPAPGTEANESTLPTATGVPGWSFSRAASSGTSAPARVPSARNPFPSFSAGRVKPA